ncbi:MAG: hypothetical protein HY678_07910 [Chloroflexi bacterium]|nr:hypothetical protein [Chloroflexota bacterium]
MRQAILEAEPISKRLETAVRAIGDSLKTIEANLMRGGPGRDPSTFGIN